MGLVLFLNYHLRQTFHPLSNEFLDPGSGVFSAVICKASFRTIRVYGALMGCTVKIVAAPILELQDSHIVYLWSRLLEPIFRWQEFKGEFHSEELIES